MTFELDVQRRVLDVYSKFQTDASKHVEKMPRDLKKSKTLKTNRHNYENKICANNRGYVDKYFEGFLCTKFDKFILIYEVMIAKKCVWPTFGYTVGQS